MSNRSDKFRVLCELKNDASTSFLVPDYWLVDLSGPPPTSFEDSRSFILRSAVRDEGGSALRSGQSVSVKGISNRLQFETAMAKITAQSDLVEVLLQVEEELDTHYTSYFGKDWSYAEETLEATPRRCLASTQSRSGNIRHEKEFEILRKILAQKNLFEVLVEWGTRDGKIFVFQVGSIRHARLVDYVGHRVIDHLCAAFTSWRPQKSFWILIGEEWRAHRLRGLKSSDLNSSHIGILFENWQCILHYYHIYLVFQRMPAGHQSWMHFLNSLQKKTYVARSVLRHIEIANHLSQVHRLPMPGQFFETRNGAIFLGQGIQDVPIQNRVFVEILEPGTVYKSATNQTFFTLDSRVLSHGFLAAAETGRCVVGGLDLKTWTFLKGAETVIINYNKCEMSHERV